MLKQEVTKRLLVKRSAHSNINYQCAVIATLRLFATKWKPCIICYLAEKPMRYNELFRIIPNISRKVLSEHLKELENDGIINRVECDKKLQHVEYSLSAKGKTLMPILSLLQNWGIDHLKDVLSIRQMIDVTMN